MERSRFDYIELRRTDGYSQDFWLSDSEAGRKRIAKLEQLAAELDTVPPPPPAQAATLTRKDLTVELTRLADAMAKLLSDKHGPIGSALTNCGPSSTRSSTTWRRCSRRRPPTAAPST